MDTSQVVFPMFLAADLCKAFFKATCRNAGTTPTNMNVLGLLQVTCCAENTPTHTHTTFQNSLAIWHIFKESKNVVVLGCVSLVFVGCFCHTSLPRSPEHVFGVAIFPQGGFEKHWGNPMIREGLLSETFEHQCFVKVIFHKHLRHE